LIRWIVSLVFALAVALVFEHALAPRPAAATAPQGSPSAVSRVVAGPMETILPIDPDRVRRVERAPPERGSDDADRAIHIVTDRGVAVHAAFDGVVLARTHLTSSGLAIDVYDRLDHRLARYGHLLRLSPTVRDGSTVAAGAVIGWVGDTGAAEPGRYELHFAIRTVPSDGVWWHGRPLDLSRLYGAESEPAPAGASADGASSVDGAAAGATGVGVAGSG